MNVSLKIRGFCASGAFLGRGVYCSSSAVKRLCSLRDREAAVRWNLVNVRVQDRNAALRSPLSMALCARGFSPCSVPACAS